MVTIYQVIITEPGLCQALFSVGCLIKSSTQARGIIAPISPMRALWQSHVESLTRLPTIWLGVDGGRICTVLFRVV